MARICALVCVYRARMHVVLHNKRVFFVLDPRKVFVFVTTSPPSGAWVGLRANLVEAASALLLLGSRTRQLGLGEVTTANTKEVDHVYCTTCTF